jgi:hypothetical protein
MTAIQTFDARRAVLVEPGEIRAGDFMRDLGRLRQVESVEAHTAPIAASVLVRFADDLDGQFSTLSIPATVTVTVWRVLGETVGAGRV